MSEALAARALAALRRRGLTLAVAEGSSGGLLAHLLTEVPGCSDVFLGGMVAYHNRLKELMGTPGETIAAHGAVSREVALAMAAAVRRWAGADVGLAVTGIAGPSGGTVAKPVGLTYVALETAQGGWCWEQAFVGDRSQVKRESALLALALLMRVLEEEGEGHGH